ncbi:NADH-quinone oxidoreductase subunit NuoE [Nakamurella lactea]|uniref:NADH-quinone oxidoreductase subunit NuoE n=1 Tax=Nakamurella lactea TaxID=459515 RepID=UPI00041B7275|nr:NADH-quinone oxidoreductase subunit NuoE [Nakamurella lactea]
MSVDVPAGQSRADAESNIPVPNQRLGIPEFLYTGTVFDEVTRGQTEEIIAKYPQQRSALLPLLHLVQSVEGFVSADGIAFCADRLNLTIAEVEAVATFYTMYKREPCGQHLVSVCTNALCAVLGGDAILSRLSGHLGIGPDETAGEPGTEGSITLEHAECLAACDHGPVVTVNYEYYDNQTPESALELVTELQAGRKPHPTRGAPLTDFRTTEREIAGIFSDLADQVNAPTASEETLRGNEIADRLRQTAPSMPESYEMPPLPERK